MSRFSRAAVALAAAGLVVAAATASPAHASPSEYLYLASGDDVTIGLNGATKNVVFEASVHYGVAPKLTVDASQLSAIATVSPKDTTMCATAGTTITCNLPAGTNDRIRIKFTVRSKAGAAAGATGALGADLQDGAGVQNSSGRVRITIGDGVDLVSYPVYEKEQPAKAGDTVWLPGIIGNEGSRTADHAAAVFTFDAGIVPDQYEGCAYATVDGGTSVSCPLPELKPGDVVQFESDGHPGMSAKVAGDAVGLKRNGVYAYSDAQQGSAAKRVKGKVASSGKKYSVKSTQQAADLNNFDNMTTVYWRISNFTDIAAVGATVNGNVGDVVKVTLAAKNVGKASIDSLDRYTPSWLFYFVVPDGTDVVAPLPPNCWGGNPSQDGYVPRVEPGLREYQCQDFDPLLKPGTVFSREFQLKITKVIPGAKGTVSFTSPWQDFALHDDNAANNSADVVVNPAAASGGGGGGGLPVTGDKTAVVAGAGALLLLGGTAIYLMARRRRVVLITPKDGGAE